MATWQLIEHASRTLVRLIQAHLNVVMPGNSVDVRVATPHSFSSLGSTNRATISVFLYRVIEHTELRNSPPRHLPDGTVRRPPLNLELCYLVTTWGGRADQPELNDATATFEEHRLFGIVLQALYDRAEVSRAELFEDPTLPPIWGERDSMQIVLESLPIEDLYRIWDSSELAYQLSATYRVRVLGLEPSQVQLGPRVVDAALQIGRAS